MADNVAVNEGSGTTVAVAADEISGVKHQRVKVQFGADGSATDVSSAAPLPVTLPADTVTTLTPPAAITGFATAANQTTSNIALAAILTAVETLDNAVAGNELQVDVVTLPALAAGTNNIGDVDVLSVTPPSTFYHGQTTVTTAGTEVALGSSQALIVGQITIKALHANTGWIYVGKNPVTSSTGFVLDAGESTVIMTDNIADVFIDSSVNGEGVSYHAS